MFQRLKKKWRVNGWRFFLIIITFAAGGSLCGFAGRKILGYCGVEDNFAWYFLYIILITLLWPAAVLLISIPLGQFSFFKKYIKKLFSTFGPKIPTPARLAIFASGAGSNAANIIKYFDGRKDIQVSLVVCNKPGAGVIIVAREHGIPLLMIEKDRFFNGDHYIPGIIAHKIDWIILAGFLWKVPLPLINAFPGKVINIHPALLPKYGGKGMYGKSVHEAVVKNAETETGISIHFVDEIYDHGKIIMQATCPVNEQDDAETVARKVHELEYQYFPAAIESAILDAKSSLNQNVSSLT